MAQLHKRFSDEQLRVLFRGYCQGQFSRADLQEMLDIGKGFHLTIEKESSMMDIPLVDWVIAAVLLCS